uniref:Secreted protein n=1 Tax=Haemonchus placei TaxID=6290 RepID=A0A0N4WJC1_HAEPC
LRSERLRSDQTVSMSFTSLFSSAATLSLSRSLSVGFSLIASISFDNSKLFLKMQDSRLNSTLLNYYHMSSSYVSALFFG